MPTLLGLDVGTLGVKGVVVTADGRVLARARRDHGLSQPRPGWAEQDADVQWWGDGVAVIRELLAGRDVDPASIATVGVCGLTPCLCLLDRDGHPLRPAILYSDNRALAQLARAQAALGGNLADCGTGQGAPLTAQAITPKWAWLAEHEPEVVRVAWCVVSSHSYVVYRLTGLASMDYDTASIVGGVFDAQQRTWNAAACAALGLDVKLLPPLRAATDLVGGVTHSAAQATGLRPGTPVIAGSGDTFPTIVGSGAVGPGDAMISFGTTGLLTLTTRPLEVAAAGPHFGAAAEEGAVTWAANVLTCGRLLAWFRDAFGAAVGAGLAPVLVPARAPDFATLDRIAATIPAGSEGLVALPHLMGRRTPAPDPHARGVLFGLTPGHTAGHVYRALLESFGYAVRQGYEPIRPRVRRIIATAGGAASPLWRQIMADILGAPIEHHAQASGSLGIAFLAAYATGQVSNFDAIRDTWLAGPDISIPDPSTRRTYDDLYRLYCHLDSSLSTAFALLPATAGADEEMITGSLSSK
ncbi:MAG: FGGY family carbohydrate kinase [Chloroflexi bacterium]|nr:FGGY family carbohydrate kinase [Chloroflexota bacterium]